MIINHLLPVFALIVLGALLKRYGVTSDAFLSVSDRLIYYIFFPALLFWKIGAADQPISSRSMGFYLAVAAAVLIVYGLSLAIIAFKRVPAFQAGAFSQSCYRFNTYIGMAVILNVWGEAGVAHFGVLIGMLIPIINVLAVATLIWFSGQSSDWASRVRACAKAMFSNPLILACVAGLLYAYWIGAFAPVVENTLRLGASVTLPLALVSIGGNLTGKPLRTFLPLALTGSLVKLVALPALGWLLLRWAAVDGMLMGIGMIFFALPASTAIYVLCSQLNSDTDFASAAVVLSTALSFFSLSAVLWWFAG